MRAESEQAEPGSSEAAVPSRAIRSMEELSLGGRTLLLRLDLNVPLDAEGRVASDVRLRAVLPTLKLACEAGARVIVASHLGQPGGQRAAKCSLLPVVESLCALLDEEIVFCPEATGSAPKALLRQMRAGQLMALENLRFWPGEEANDTGFARALTALADCYVDDAFASMHRSHASIVGVPLLLSDVAHGPLVAAELVALERFAAAPKAGRVAIVGGAKVQSKVGLLRALTGRVEHLAIGGAMALPFLRAQGHETGAADVDKAAILLAESVIQRAREAQCRLHLPQDHLGARQPTAEALPTPITSPSVPAHLHALDIGPVTAAAWARLAAQAESVLWNGPLGVAEWPAFADGSRTLATGVAACQGFSLVGGGDSLAVLERGHLLNRVGHASTGGGATLAYLEHGTLPGLTALVRRAR